VEVVFTFDGDSAGQKAAMRAYLDEDKFVTQTFVAVEPNGMDPCDLRLAKGDTAVRDLVARREPMIAFALRSVLSRYDLDTAEGRVAALRVAAPLVAKIKDRALRPEYSRKLAGDLGMDPEPVQRAVAAAARGAGIPAQPPPPAVESTADSPQGSVEREALKLALQAPVLAGPMFDALGAEVYQNPVHAAVRTGIEEAGGAAGAVSGVVWVERVRDACADLAAKALAGELAVEPLHVDGELDPRYVQVQLAKLELGSVTRRVRELKSRLQRMNPVSNKDGYLALLGELASWEQHARALRNQAVEGL
jgi:DNA primase